MRGVGEQRREDREQRDACDLYVGEVREAWRRLDLQAAAIGNVDRLDDGSTMKSPPKAPPFTASSSGSICRRPTK